MRNSVSPPKPQSRPFLAEISLNTLQKRDLTTLKKKLKIDSTCTSPSKPKNTSKPSHTKPLPKTHLPFLPSASLHSLPSELQMAILSFLPTDEIVHTISKLNSSLHSLTKNKFLWRLLEKEQPLSALDHKILKQTCVVERRSKGKLFKAIDRRTGFKCCLRVIYLDITNAGYDDGIPTSVLREISYLSVLNHQNVARIIDADVDNKKVMICTMQYQYNLKELMKNYIGVKKLKNGNAKKGQDKVYAMPLFKIKVKLIFVVFLFYF